MAAQSARKGPMFKLTRVPLDRNGYTKSGPRRYFGIGGWKAVYDLEQVNDGHWNHKIDEYLPAVFARDKREAQEYVRKHYSASARFK